MRDEELEGKTWLCIRWWIEFDNGSLLADLRLSEEEEEEEDDRGRKMMKRLEKENQGTAACLYIPRLEGYV